MPDPIPCRVLVTFEDDRPDQEDDEADLRLGDDGTLLLSYWDDDGVVVLVGGEQEPGHYEWLARSRPRRGTLRRENAHIFTGAWEQGGECGTLRVALSVAGGEPSEEPEEER